MKFHRLAFVAALSLAAVSANARSLAGSTLLYVRNATTTPIVSIVAVAHHQGFFSNWTTVHNILPVGIVGVHRQAMVQFPSCIDDIHIVTANGLTHDLYNTNVCRKTYLTIQGW